MEEINCLEVDLIVMDVNMPFLDGIAATYAVKELRPEIRILGLSMYYEEKYILNMIQAGANGYLVKSSAPDEIIHAIRSIMQANYYFNDYVSLAMVKAFQVQASLSRHTSPAVLLNIRELEVLKLVCEEYSNIEIASKLFLS